MLRRMLQQPEMLVQIKGLVSAEGIESASTRSFKYLQSTDGNQSTSKYVLIELKGLQADCTGSATYATRLAEANYHQHNQIPFRQRVCSELRASLMSRYFPFAELENTSV